MCFSCWITKATDTHSQYVIFIAFPQYQWLRDHAPKLCYMYNVCLVYLLSPVKQRLGQSFASGHEWFLPRTSQFIIYTHPDPIYTLATVSFTFWNQNKCWTWCAAERYLILWCWTMHMLCHKRQGSNFFMIQHMQQPIMAILVLASSLPLLTSVTLDLSKN